MKRTLLKKRAVPRGKAEFHVRVVLTREKGGYVVTSPDVPALTTQGRTLAEAIAMAEDALALLRRTCPEEFDRASRRPSPRKVLHSFVFAVK